MAAARMQEGEGGNTGSPIGGVARAKPESRERQSGPLWVAERPVVPVSPGNAGGGKGPWFGNDAVKEERTWGLARA